MFMGAKIGKEAAKSVWMVPASVVIGCFFPMNANVCLL